MIVKHMMNNSVICLDESTTINETINIMRKKDINFFPITKNDHLTGVITTKDILFRSQHINKNNKISKIMTKSIIYMVNENAPIETAKKIMNKYNVNQLVVIHDDYIKGIISKKDLAKS